jgi:hypothetical protein
MCCETWLALLESVSTADSRGAASLLLPMLLLLLHLHQ